MSEIGLGIKGAELAAEAIARELPTLGALIERSTANAKQATELATGAAQHFLENHGFPEAAALLGDVERVEPHRTLHRELAAKLGVVDADESALNIWDLHRARPTTFLPGDLLKPDGVRGIGSVTKSEPGFWAQHAYFPEQLKDADKTEALHAEPIPKTLDDNRINPGREFKPGHIIAGRLIIDGIFARAFRFPD